MKILVVAPQPFFTPRGTPFSVYYRTLVTCELGHEVHLLTYGQGEDVDIPGCTIHRIPAFRWLGPVRIGPSLHKLFLDVFMIAWTKCLLLRNRFDIVHAHEEAAFWCFLLKPFFRFRMIYDMHSSLPQQLNNFQFTKSRVIHWIFDKLERRAVKAAEGVITICPVLRDYARTLTANHGKVVLIENSLFDPVKFANGNPGGGTDSDDADARRVRNVDEWLSRHPRDQVIAYAGTLEVYQGIDRLLEAFGIAVRRLPLAGLLIVGGMPLEVENFRSLSDRLGLGDSVHFTGQVPQPEAQRLVARAGVAISPRFAGNNTPMKIYQLMGAGVPMIATRIESHTQILNDEISVLSEVSTSALADAIVQALGDPDRLQTMAERARAWYELEYSRDAYTAKMRRLFALVS
jgi:glycosyltransferase involved in cell wall biosynthesis